MRRITLRLEEINPFDPHHVRSDDDPGFIAEDETPDEHLLGAEYCRDMIEAGLQIRPIAVCAMDLVPEGKRPADPKEARKPYQRLDGFKRYWGHRLAGATEIACVVHDAYRPGIQSGMPMTIKDEGMGEVKNVLSEGVYEAKKFPYANRFIVEDCVNETVHVHLGNIRTEFTRHQFLWFADRMTEAAKRLRKIVGKE